MADESKKLPAPSMVRHLSSSTAVYRTVVEDALKLIESATCDNPEVMEPVLEVQDHLRILLDQNEMGSLPAVLRCCSVLLGEASA
jgi:hypothetical protein